MAIYLGSTASSVMWGLLPGEQVEQVLAQPPASIQRKSLKTPSGLSVACLPAHLLGPFARGVESGRMKHVCLTTSSSHLFAPCLAVV